MEPALAVSHGVVTADHALFLATKDVIDLAGVCEGDEGAVFERRFGGEASVVVGQVALFDEAVCGLDPGDAGEAEFPDEAVLEGAEGALGSAARLGRVGGDVLDAELVQGAADLGAPVLGNLAACLRGVEVVAGTVGIEAAGQALGAEHLLEARGSWTRCLLRRPGRPRRSRS